MREVQFLQQNADRWRRDAALLADSRHADPDELARAFVELTDDLAWARTFYPGSKTEAHLNAQAALVHRHLYRTRRGRRGWVRRFWGGEVPRAVGEAHSWLGLALLLFVLAVAVGVLSARQDPLFLRLVMGDAYVDMTEANIAAGDPLAVYKQERSLPMFLGLARHNIGVAFNAFASGFLTPFATGLLLGYNGLMLGAFHTFFAGHGLLWRSLLGVWIHGTLEITAIVVAGGAGLHLGAAWLFPGTLPRLESLTRASRRGVRILLGL
ncbi:MAG TPA: stage II sporulation protein M, partial [Rhodothermales bacterium]|nr:stage II sporulation protein M [Rhodothermales bacterium]